MPDVAFVFPGQGAQYVGMGVGLAEAYPEARAVFDRASAALGEDLLALCRDGPEEALQRTENTQPAILAASVAALAAARARGLEPRLAAGLSLGEYSALVAAGALRLEDAVPLVRLRGTFMQEATEGRDVAMVAVLGLDRKRIAEACDAGAPFGVVEPANFNAPGQVVIGGDRPAVQAAAAAARRLGARRAVALAVSAPFHTSLMRPAAERLRAVLEEVPIAPARIPVIGNASAAAVQDPAEIRRLLAAQVDHPVRWEESVRLMAALGARAFVEVGPGATLVAMIRRILDGAVTARVETPETLDEAAALAADPVRG